jgi:uncharacterized protein
MDSGSLSYEKWVEEALRDVIKRALKQTAVQGLPDDHHFFITFQTNHADVDIPGHLRAEHPEEMTIVLQHQFTDLNVTETGFSVSLSFNGRPSYLSIPYSAIVAFADPAVNFVLQLKMAEEIKEPAAEEKGPREVPTALEPQVKPVEEVPHTDSSEPAEDDGKMGEVITLDAFRKK